MNRIFKFIYYTPVRANTTRGGVYINIPFCWRIELVIFATPSLISLLSLFGRAHRIPPRAHNCCNIPARYCRCYSPYPTYKFSVSGIEFPRNILSAAAPQHTCGCVNHISTTTHHVITTTAQKTYVWIIFATVHARKSGLIHNISRFKSVKHYK